MKLNCCWEYIYYHKNVDYIPEVFIINTTNPSLVPVNVTNRESSISDMNSPEKVHHPFISSNTWFFINGTEYKS